MFMDEEDKPDEMSLRVTEINKASAGRGLCSAGIHVARRLNLKAGEIVEISGNKTTAGIFFPNSEDKGKQIIRMDGLVRLNAETGFDKFVKVKKARPMPPAQRVVVEPLNTKAQIPPRKIRDSLMNRPVVKGDNVSLINMFLPNDRGELRLVVVETTPEESIVQITPTTVVEIKDLSSRRREE